MLQFLIECGNTGTAEELAQKLCVSRRTLFNYFDVLKNQGLNIKYSRFRNTYYFIEDDE